MSSTTIIIGNLATIIGPAIVIGGGEDQPMAITLMRLPESWWKDYDDNRRRPRK